jgi:hypothetical protein
MLQTFLIIVWPGMHTLVILLLIYVCVAYHSSTVSHIFINFETYIFWFQI